MSWKGDYWGKGGALARAKMIFNISRKTPSDMVRLASVHYSAAGTAWQRVKHGQIWYLWRLYRSARAASSLADQAYIRHYDLTADDVDVLCSIWFQRGNRESEAAHALQLKVVGENVVPHTKAFLLMHKIRFGTEALAPHIGAIKTLAVAAESQKELAQAGRVYRQLHDLLPATHSDSSFCWEKAIRLATAAGATDQLEKMGIKPQT